MEKNKTTNNPQPFSLTTPGLFRLSINLLFEKTKKNKGEGRPLFYITPLFYCLLILKKDSLPSSLNPTF